MAFPPAHAPFFLPTFFTMKIDLKLTPQKLQSKTTRVFELAGRKIRAIDAAWDPAKGTPVFTVKGRYTSRGWTEGTQGFQFGRAFLQYDATREAAFLDLGRRKTIALMASHVSHVGVHDHGFNNVSTYGNLRRLQREGRIPANVDEMNFCELALKVSGAVQAARYAPTSVKAPWSPVAGAPGVVPRRLRLLVQRAAVALRGHDPLDALAGRGAPVGSRADGRGR